jgi:hypothetical protein
LVRAETRPQSLKDEFHERGTNEKILFFSLLPSSHFGSCVNCGGIKMTVETASGWDA